MPVTATAGTNVAIIGRGFLGLSAAAALLDAEPSTSVTIFASDTFKKCSDGAGALWRPVFTEGPEIVRWSTDTFTRLAALANAGESTGVSWVTGIELFCDPDTAVPAWAAMVEGFSVLREHELGLHRKSGFRVGHRFSVPIIDPSVYLSRLETNLSRLGVRFVNHTVEHIENDPELEQFVAVINCTGAGAAELVPDPEVIRGRGQTVRVRAPEITEFVVAPDAPEGLSYVIPRPDGTVVVGGTHECVETAAEATAATVAGVSGLLARALKLEPRLATAKLIEIWAGGRPERIGGPRLAIEPLKGGRQLVHCYGHGGSGFTVGLAAAANAAALALSGCLRPHL